MRRPDYNRRVVVTGLGVVSPVGNDVDDRVEQPRPRLQRARARSRASTRPRTSHKPPARSRASRRSSGWTSRPRGAREPQRAVRGRGREAGARRLGHRDHDGQPRRDRRSCSARGGGGPELIMDNMDVWDTRARALRQPVLHRQQARRHGVRARSRSRPASAATTCASSRPARPARTTSARRPRRSAAATARAVIAGSTESPLSRWSHVGFGNMRGIGSPRPGEPHRDGLAGRST